jgi:hypothetical protein
MRQPNVTPDSELSTLDFGSLEDDCLSPMFGKLCIADECRSGDSMSLTTPLANCKEFSKSTEADNMD